MIDAETEAQILRLYRAESWPVGTIARELKLHYSAVQRVVREPKEARPSPVRPSIIDPYRGFIGESLERWPDLTARRLFDMCIERGYPGAPGHFRALIRKMRPDKRKPSEAFLRLRSHPGEEGQVDWGHFGHVAVGRARRQLLAFVVVLSWSRMVFARFFIGGSMPSFLRGHVEAFEFFGGVPRTLLYDNLKSAVLERRGDAIRFHPTMIQLSTHYEFKAQPVGVRKGNEKGRVERAIRFLRDSFFAGRRWSDLEDLNIQARDWCLNRAAERPWPDDTGRVVGDVFEEERPQLRSLPGDQFCCDDVQVVQIQKTPYARYDGNDYTVPHSFVRRTLSVAASETKVRVLDGTNVLAVHDRSYGKGEQIEDEEHLKALRAQKRKSRDVAPNDRLRRSAPSTDALIEELAQRGENLGSVIAHLLRLLDQFGAQALDGAAQTALERGTPHPRSVQMILEADEQRRNEPPRIEVELPDDPRVREAAVRPHSLADYDTFRTEQEEGEASHGE